jgi:hypothetical protein
VNQARRTSHLYSGNRLAVEATRQVRRLVRQGLTPAQAEHEVAGAIQAAAMEMHEAAEAAARRAA